MLTRLHCCSCLLLWGSLLRRGLRRLCSGLRRLLRLCCRLRWGGLLLLRCVLWLVQWLNALTGACSTSAHV